MPLEFRCPQCQQQLRVPDDAAGKQAKCPKCGAIAAVPVPGVGVGSGEGLPASASSPSVASAPGGWSTGPQPDPSPPSGSPFGDAANAPAGNPFAESYPAKPSLNPYASPASGAAPLVSDPGLPVRNQRVEVGPIWNYAFQIWQHNLGLLVGVTLVATILSNVVSLPFGGVQFALQVNDAPEAAFAVSVLSTIASLVLQTFLNIGQMQIALKLCRGQPAEFSDLFGGGAKLLPIVGMTLLTAVPIILAFFMLVVPLVILIVLFWPCYLLVVDGKSRVLDSFGVAYSITEGNRLTSFLMILVTFGLVLAGFLMCCVGVLFMAPLATVLSVTAYLMMSGQIAVPQLPPAMRDYYAPAGKDAGQF